MTIHHFILTRFNLLIWVKDKTGKEFDRELWLQKRLELFETFCLPSLTSQTCKEFTWILLVDAETPQPYRNRIMSYRDVCKQILIIPVRREGGLQFAKIMGEVVRKQLVERNASSNDLCLTTYLDNDDCLHHDYVANVQELSRQCLSKPFFLSFDYGLQYYTEHTLATRILYPNNHFMTAVEMAGETKTCFGFGSHFLLEKNGVAKVVHITEKESPMWIEVIHEGNVDNDVKMTLDTHLFSSSSSIKEMFGIDVKCNALPSPAFFLRVLKQIKRRGQGQL